MVCKGEEGLRQLTTTHLDAAHHTIELQHTLYIIVYIAMVFQNYALYPHMTVYANMAFALKLKGYDKKEIDKRVKEAAEILGISHLLDRKPKQLSGG